MERLRGDGRQCRQTSIEAAARLRLFRPGRKCRRRDIILTRARRFGARDERPLRCKFRLLEISCCGHGDIAKTTVPVALAWMPPDHKQVGEARYGAIQELRAVRVAQQTNISPDR